MAETTHQSGLALVRLRKDLAFYEEKYETWSYGLQKMFLLMEKQHNRGQDGAGLAAIQLDMPHGHPYIHIERASGSNALREVFQATNKRTNPSPDLDSVEQRKVACGFVAELFLGHLRFESSKTKRENTCHPFHRVSNWKTKNVVVAGNFNLTNFDHLFEELLRNGQHPVETTDVVILMQRVAAHLDEAVTRLHDELSVLQKAEQDQLDVRQSAAYEEAQKTNKGISQLIANQLDLPQILQLASKDWDGGYVFATLLGHGDAMVLRDPHGIRPAYYYIDDEVAVVASERPPIQTAFDLPSSAVKELPPGHALLLRADNTAAVVPVHPPQPLAACSFERIYFSRPNDEDIYRERKALGRYLCPAVLAAIGNDLERTVFTFIPNAGEVSFCGLIEEIHRKMTADAKAQILALGPDVTAAALDTILAPKLRTEKVVLKDLKLRTFIAEELERSNDIAHIYDVTYGAVRAGVDALVAVDDSIVRGSTMSHSILRMFARLHPRQVVLVSSAPQIRYPDPYGIDMGRLRDLVAFRAAVALLQASDQAALLDEVYEECVRQEVKHVPDEARPNLMKRIYAPFTAEEISEKVAGLLRPAGTSMGLQVVYQRVEAVHAACPNHRGDWYFTGNYPTPGGAKICNRAYMAWYEAYQVGQSFDSMPLSPSFSSP